MVREFGKMVDPVFRIHEPFVRMDRVMIDDKTLFPEGTQEKVETDLGADTVVIGTGVCGDQESVVFFDLKKEILVALIHCVFVFDPDPVFLSRIDVLPSIIEPEGAKIKA